MNIKVPTIVEKEIVAIRIVLPLDEDDVEKDFPMINGDNVLTMVVRISDGQILNYPSDAGTGTRKLHVKIRDSGSYYLLDEMDEVVLSIVEDYVPNGIVPGEYGDYVELYISDTGKILNWKSEDEINIKSFFCDADLT